MRGPCSIPTGDNILSLDFFHVVKPLMPILPLLLILSMCEKPERIRKLTSPANHCVQNICLTSLTRAKCGTRSTLCWKILNISDSTELFAL